MPILLAIDCSSDICSVALAYDDTIRELCSDTARQHARETLPMVQQLLDEAGLQLSSLDAIAITQGPGSFTGLRIGVAVAQGLAFAHNTPVIPVSSLATMALIAHRQHAAALMQIALKARDNEVYWATYRQDGQGVELLGHEQVLAIDSLAPDFNAGERWFAVGNGWEEGSDLRLRVLSHAAAWLPTIESRASALAALALRELARGNTVAAENALPVYLKEQEYK